MLKLSCPNKSCEDHGKVGDRNLAKNGKDRRGVQRYLCKTCKRTFTHEADLPKAKYKPQPHQRKVCQKGKKSLRGQPERYSEVKRNFSFSLTPTVVQALDAYGASLEISRSEIMERFVRKVIAEIGDAEELSVNDLKTKFEFENKIYESNIDTPDS